MSKGNIDQFNINEINVVTVYDYCGKTHVRIDNTTNHTFHFLFTGSQTDAIIFFQELKDLYSKVKLSEYF